MPNAMALSFDRLPIPGHASTAMPLIVDWYSSHARDLPWRRTDSTPWSILVSEVMLQQTPVARVLPVFEQWMARWSSPADLAGATSGDAIRAWGRLGYPRRALRLHSAAIVCMERHGGEVPRTVTELRGLPGVGEYTAAAVASFAFRQRHAVLDTNVRRVHARILEGVEFEPSGAPSSAERRRALTLLPSEPAQAATTSIAVMELGALLCTARAPNCGACPVADSCGWALAGKPQWAGPVRRGQTYAGTDRQCRGRLLALLRDVDGSVTAAELADAWSDGIQRERALASLVADGLVHTNSNTELNSPSRYSLPN